MSRHMTPEEYRASPEGKSAAQVCHRIGCSGMTPEKCPGNPNCEIFEKAVLSGVVDDIIDEVLPRLRERE